MQATPPPSNRRRRLDVPRNMAGADLEQMIPASFRRRPSQDDSAGGTGCRWPLAVDLPGLMTFDPVVEPDQFEDDAPPRPRRPGFAADLLGPTSPPRPSTLPATTLPRTTRSQMCPGRATLSPSSHARGHGRVEWAPNPGCERRCTTDPSRLFSAGSQGCREVC